MTALQYTVIYAVFNPVQLIYVTMMTAMLQGRLAEYAVDSDAENNSSKCSVIQVLHFVPNQSTAIVHEQGRILIDLYIDIVFQLSFRNLQLYFIICIV